MNRPPVIVTGPLDDLRSPLARFLQEAARLGPLHVLPWPDGAIRDVEGREPRFPLAERVYFLQALRYVQAVHDSFPFSGPHALPPELSQSGGAWVVHPSADHPQKQDFCRTSGMNYHILPEAALAGFPLEPHEALPGGQRKVIITGSFDWLHTGHIRFFEEVATHGALIAVVGHDANIALLKGPGHPLIPQEERLYMVQAVRYVRLALIASGHGWLDAEPEIECLKPDLYAVNEDGDRPEKRAYCESHGIEYRVLRREPKPGLNRRSSTELRGF